MTYTTITANTITTTARRAANLTTRPEVFYLQKITTQELGEDGHGLLIEGPARVTSEHGMTWVIFTVWMGSTMVELKVASTDQVTLID